MKKTANKKQKLSPKFVVGLYLLGTVVALMVSEQFYLLGYALIGEQPYQSGTLLDIKSEETKIVAYVIGSIVALPATLAIPRFLTNRLKGPYLVVAFFGLLLSLVLTLKLFLIQIALILAGYVVARVLKRYTSYF